MEEPEEGHVHLYGMYDRRTAYPIGSYYVTTGEENPAALYGGRWTEVKGRVLLGADENHEMNTTGGDESFMLTMDQLPIAAQPMALGMDGGDEA